MAHARPSHKEPPVASALGSFGALHVATVRTSRAASKYAAVFGPCTAACPHIVAITSAATTHRLQARELRARQLPAVTIGVIQCPQMIPQKRRMVTIDVGVDALQTLL